MKPTPPQTPQQQQECHLDELGYCFIRKCIEIVEARGLDDQGLYRVGGVNSRVARLLQMCLDRKNFDLNTGQVTLPDFSDPVEWETKTITSALKNYLRNLSEPLMTYNLHPAVIDAAKIDDAETRTRTIRNLIQQLPITNFSLLKILVQHLRNVASHSRKNLMTVSNLGICFAPTLMRGPDESSLSIMEIKYSNVVANTLIEEYESIFNDPRLNQTQNECYSSLPSSQQQTSVTQPLRFCTNSIHANNNHNDQFGLGLPSVPYYNQSQIQQQELPSLNHPPSVPTMNSLVYYPVNTNTSSLQYYPVNANLNNYHYISMNPSKMPYRSNKVITLYACVADTESELSFGPNEIITDVRNSAEVGWLIGTLERNGQRGLLPDNYVMFI